MCAWPYKVQLSLSSIWAYTHTEACRCWISFISNPISCANQQMLWRSPAMPTTHSALLYKSWELHPNHSDTQEPLLDLPPNKVPRFGVVSSRFFFFCCNMDQCVQSQLLYPWVSEGSMVMFSSVLYNSQLLSKPVEIAVPQSTLTYLSQNLPPHWSWCFFVNNTAQPNIFCCFFKNHWQAV